MIWKVRYIGSRGCELHHALSDGQRHFKAGFEYVLTNYRDFARLIKHGDFEATQVPESEPVEAPVVETPEEDVAPANEETFVIKPKTKKGENN